jgi:hypothetical protein
MSESRRFQFRLNPELDKDLIEWLESKHEGERGVFVRDALRRGISGSEPVVVQRVAPAVPEPAQKRMEDRIENMENNNVDGKLDKLMKGF